MCVCVWVAFQMEAAKLNRIETNALIEMLVEDPLFNDFCLVAEQAAAAATQLVLKAPGHDGKADIIACQSCKREFASKHSLHIHIGLNKDCKAVLWPMGKVAALKGRSGGDGGGGGNLAEKWWQRLPGCDSESTAIPGMTAGMYMTYTHAHTHMYACNYSVFVSVFPCVYTRMLYIYTRREYGGVTAFCIRSYRHPRHSIMATGAWLHAVLSEC
jgi:hypothetical protein